MRALLILCTLCIAAVSQADTLLIRDVDLYDGTQLQSGTDIVIQDGRIKAIGENLSAPDNATIIDGKGKSVTPGLFNADTKLGLTEVSSIASTTDYATENTRYTAALKVADAFNPHTVLIPESRRFGLSHALITPSSQAGLFGGQAALIHLGKGGNAILNDSVAVTVALGEAGQQLAGGSRAVAIALLREALADAADFAANKAAVNAGNRRSYNLSLPDLKALVPVLRGNKPLIVHVNRASDISAVLALAKTYKLKLILSQASEAWRVGDQIARAQVPVILDPIVNLPSRYETLGARLDNVAILHQTGVNLLFTGKGGAGAHNPYLVRQSAGNAVANGLPKLAAIAAMTSNPAKVFGLKGAGTINTGQLANLVLWSGDPLEMTSEPDLVLINGENMPLTSRSTRLRDRYFKYLQKANN